jgi:hypothetical protein
MLTFRSDLAMISLVEHVTAASGEIMQWFVNETRGQGSGSGLSAEGQAATELNAAELVGTSIIKQQVAFYADAILSSYGTGSLADTSAGSYWSEYKASAEFNPARPGTPIVGRPKGSYIDPWGVTHESSGRNRGRNIEGKYITNEDGTRTKITPIAPTMAIQNAEAWLCQAEGRAKRVIAMKMQEWIDGIDRFFVEV